MDWNLLMDIALGAAAFKLAWSVDRTQKKMLEVQAQQANILQQLSDRVSKVESKLNV